jgi:hypothetical protein
MKWIVALVVISGFACSHKTVRESSDQRFRNSLADASSIGSFKRLTDDDRAIYPVFSPGDSIIFFRRLLLTSAADTFAYFPDEWIKPYGVNVLSSEFYTLEGTLVFPSVAEVDTMRLPHIFNEKTVWGTYSPDGKTFAFETIHATEHGVHLIYVVKDDSIRQLSYGLTSCYLERFSNTGRYLTAIYGDSSAHILIFDLNENKAYRIERGTPRDSLFDFMTVFSPTDTLMAFVRSDKKYRWGNDYFGDIWVMRLNRQ